MGIAEDDEDFRSILCDILSDNGFIVQEASNGQEALALLVQAEEPFNLLITDFNMPYMNGLELIEESLKRSVEIDKIIIISGISTNEKHLDGLLAKYHHISFIPKMCGLNKLLDAIRTT